MASILGVIWSARGKSGSHFAIGSSCLRMPSPSSCRSTVESIGSIGCPMRTCMSGVAGTPIGESPAAPMAISWSPRHTPYTALVRSCSFMCRSTMSTTFWASGPSTARRGRLPGNARPGRVEGRPTRREAEDEDHSQRTRGAGSPPVPHRHGKPSFAISERWALVRERTRHSSGGDPFGLYCQQSDVVGHKIRFDVYTRPSSVLSAGATFPLRIGP